MTTDPFTKKRRRKEGEELKVAANDAITIHLLRKVDGQVLLEEVRPLMRGCRPAKRMS